MLRITKLELIAAIGPSQLEGIHLYLKGSLSVMELEQLIGKQKVKILTAFTTEYVDA